MSECDVFRNISFDDFAICHLEGDEAELIEHSLSLWEVPGSIPGGPDKVFISPFPRSINK